MYSFRRSLSQPHAPPRALTPRASLSAVSSAGAKKVSPGLHVKVGGMSMLSATSSARDRWTKTKHAFLVAGWHPNTHHAVASRSRSNLVSPRGTTLPDIANGGGSNS